MASREAYFLLSVISRDCVKTTSLCCPTLDALFPRESRGLRQDMEYRRSRLSERLSCMRRLCL
jgi:hypothetical protein